MTDFDRPDPRRRAPSGHKGGPRPGRPPSRFASKPRLTPQEQEAEALSRRQPLTHVEGEESRYGDAARAQVLARAFAIHPRDRDLPVQGIHGVHPYPARLHPAWARALLGLVPRDGVVLDPFCGSGTVLVETARSGRRALGSDVNSVGLRIARLRTTRRDEHFLASLARAATTVHRAAEDRPRSPFGILAKEERRFPPHVLTQLINLRDAIDDVRSDEVREVLLLGMTPLLGKFGRKHGRIAPTVGRRAVRDEFLRRMEKMAMELADYSNTLPEHVGDPDIQLADARRVPWDEATVDAVITSPPYPGVYHYAAEQGLAAAWLAPAGSTEDLLAGARLTELGRRGARPGSWEKAMRAVLRSLVWVCKPGGSIYFVVGDGVEEEVPVFVDEVLMGLIEEPGVKLRVVAAVSQTRPHFHPPTRYLFVRKARREHLVQIERTA